MELKLELCVQWLYLWHVHLHILTFPRVKPSVLAVKVAPVIQPLFLQRAVSQTLSGLPLGFCLTKGANKVLQKMPITSSHANKSTSNPPGVGQTDGRVGKFLIALPHLI